MPRKIKDQIGNRFGRLIVTKRGGGIVSPSGRKYITWYCNCDCGKKDILVKANSLFSGNTKSCGCLKNELFTINLAEHNKNPRNRNYTKNRKMNNYDLYDEFVVGYTSNTNKKFLIDKEDYDKVKKFCWSEYLNGAIATTVSNKKQLLLHRFVMDCKSEDLVVDHINHNKWDNRKVNLRCVSNSKNSMNRIKTNRNTSGHVGIVYSEDRNKKWRAYITINGKKIYLGGFYKKEDAIQARKAAEEKYFGEYSYEASMKQSENYKLEKEI